MLPGVPPIAGQKDLGWLDEAPNTAGSEPKGGQRGEMGNRTTKTVLQPELQQGQPVKQLVHPDFHSSVEGSAPAFLALAALVLQRRGACALGAAARRSVPFSSIAPPWKAKAGNPLLPPYNYDVSRHSPSIARPLAALAALARGRVVGGKVLRPMPGDRAADAEGDVDWRGQSGGQLPARPRWTSRAIAHCAA